MADDPTDSGNSAWVLCASALVMLMTPALAMFYGGFVSDKAVVNTMMMSFSTLAVVSVTWSIGGYSLAFGSGNPYLGGGTFGFFDSSDRVRQGTTIPEHAYFMFQLMFAVITSAVISGAVVQRMQLWAFVAFATVWNLIVYVPLARWVFYSGGWMAQWGVLDFAGGLVVETASGVSAFVLAYWLGPAHEAARSAPHNITYILLGAGLLFFGWFGFNAGSALVSGYLAARAFANTHLSAAAAMCAWAACEIVAGREGWGKGRPTAIGAAEGAVVGLVAITPACGYVSQMWSLFIGGATAAIVFALERLSLVRRAGVEDTLGCFLGHGVSGMLGILWTGVFASTAEGSPADGLLRGNPALLGRQAGGLVATVATCVVGTTAAFWLVAALGRGLGLELRVPAEAAGDVDGAYHGESAYAYAVVPEGDEGVRGTPRAKATSIQ